ncbi:MAG: sigma 54-interacting transcriptional regulator [Methylococcales bacterium]
MKPTNPVKMFFAAQPVWLDQFENTVLFQNLLALGAYVGLYIVDKNQLLLYWSGAAAELTGHNTAEVLDKPCVPLYAINPGSDPVNVINLSRPDGSKCHVKKAVQVLYDKQGNFAGGVGLLLRVAEPSASADKPSFTADSRPSFQGILSRSPAMQDVFHIIQNAAETAATVLVRGESGAGKELVARAIHDLSVRRAAPFLAINCAALSSNLLESELFGHVRGAFTGAVKDHSGLFQRAHGGTLFLDEVAELPLELQAKLLRVIQERNYIPVGGDRSIDVDVRIVAATHRSLREEVRAGRFREDLMYRLRVVPIFIPPLRERREDIGLLIWHFIQQHNAENFRKIDKIDPQAMRVLLDYRWPGNIRELHNVVEYAFAVGRGTTLRLSELPPEFREPDLADQIAPTFKSAPLSADQEKAAFGQALAQSQGNITAAAHLLGMSRATFWRKRKLHEL